MVSCLLLKHSSGGASMVLISVGAGRGHWTLNTTACHVTSDEPNSSLFQSRSCFEKIVEIEPGKEKTVKGKGKSILPQGFWGKLLGFNQSDFSI